MLRKPRVKGSGRESEAAPDRGGTVRHGRVLGVLGLLALASSPALPAQQPAGTSSSTTLHWWDGVAVVGSLAVIGLFDEAAQRATQEDRTPFKDDVAAVVRHMGQPEVFATIPIGIFVTGVATHHPALRRSGIRVAGSLALAGVAVTAGKFVFGRLRPFQTAEPYEWKPFSGADAFPSGHTTMAFGLATALANEIRRPWATVILMAGAAGTGWSRINDNKHWLSDVFAGAALGVTSAELVDGRWALGRLRPPAVFVTPPSRTGGAALGWRMSVALP